MQLFSSLTIDQKIQVWNAIGTWVAGIGTLAAVVVSLYLARDSQRVRLGLTVGIREVHVLGHGLLNRVIVFEVVNLCDRPVTITSVGWVVRKYWRKKWFVQIPSEEFLGSLPRRLERSDSLIVGVRVKEEGQPISDLRSQFSQFAGSKIASLRGYAVTSTGEVVLARIDNSFLNELREAKAE